MVLASKEINQDLNINDNCFDIIRIVAAYTVFLGHFITHFNVPFPVLFDIAYFVRGVPVFFLLSGFFIAASLERYTAKEFLIRRFVRIYPAMWICILLNTLIIFCIYALPPIKDLFVYFFTQFTVFQFYTGDWLRGYGVGNPNGALWMISCMIQFYIIAIFIAKWMKSRSLKTWISVIILFAMVSLISAKLQGLFPEIIWKLYAVEIIPFLYIFMFGMAMYYHRHRMIPVLKRYWYLFCVIYIAWEIFVPSSVKAVFDGVLYNVVTTVFLSLMIGAIGFAFGRHRLKADYSYSFYLYHMVVINIIYHLFIQRITSVFSLLGILSLSTVLVVLLAVLSQKLIEQKTGNLLQKQLLKRFC